MGYSRPPFLKRKMLRAYCSQWDGGDLLPRLERDEVHHLVRVRRVRIGEEVEILNGRGDIGLAEVTNCGSRSVDLCLKSQRHVSASSLSIHLLVAMPKGKTFPVLLHKAVELGVAEITPLLSENVEVPAGRAEEKRERWESVLTEALKQSGNPWMPRLNPTCSLEEALQGGATKQRICAALQTDALPLWNLLGTRLQPEGKIDVFVGPEGDFSTGEYDLLRAGGCTFTTLGPLVLKVETAASLVVGVLQVWASGSA